MKLEKFVNDIKNIFSARNVWIPIYQNNFETTNVKSSFFLTFTDNNEISLNSSCWEHFFGTYYCKRKGEFGPEYHYLTIYRHGNSNLDYIEISEEFRLFYNLYKEDENYYTADSDVEPELVIRYNDSEKCYEIKYDFLIEYLAYKKLYAVLNFEIDYHVENTKLKNRDFSGGNYRFERRIFNPTHYGKYGEYNLVRYMGKVTLDYKLIKSQEKTVKFLVGKTNKNKNRYESITGYNISADCDVCFNRKVLKRYIDEPSKYRVSYFCVSGEYWVLNNLCKESLNEIYASLHSLSSLPYKEQLHWSKYAKIPEDTHFITADIHSVSFLISYYNNFKYYWNLKNENKLFNDLTEENKYKINQIYVPLTKELSEFSHIVTNICICFVDCLNKSFIRSLTSPEYIIKDNNGNIQNSTRAALKDYFNSLSIDFSKYDEFLKHLIALRDNATHPKSNDFLKAKVYFKIDEVGYQLCVINIAKTMLEILKLFRYFY